MIVARNKVTSVKTEETLTDKLVGHSNYMSLLHAKERLLIMGVSAGPIDGRGRGHKWNPSVEWKEWKYNKCFQC